MSAQIHPREREFVAWLTKRTEESNDVLFEGRWVSEQEAAQRYRRLQWRSRRRILELGGLGLLVFVLTFVPFLVLAILGGIVF